jgi:hypothetical protein
MASPHVPSSATKLQSPSITINGANQKKLLCDLRHLKAERQLLLARIKTLEELNHDTIFCEEYGFDNNSVFNCQMNTLFEPPTGMFKLEQSIKLLEQRISAIEDNMGSHGKKTTQRIEKLKGLLRVYGGSQAFKQLQIDLNLSPSQFTRLVKCLDKRYFEIRRCPGAKIDEVEQCSNIIYLGQEKRRKDMRYHPIDMPVQRAAFF